MTNWFKVVTPLAMAAVLVSALGFAVTGGPVLAGNGHGSGGSATPSLAVTTGAAFSSEVTEGQPVAISGSGFPRSTAVFVVVTGMPSILVESDGSGSFETSTSLSEPGTYWFSACFYKRNGWDCNSTSPVSVTVQ